MTNPSDAVRTAGQFHSVPLSTVPVTTTDSPRTTRVNRQNRSARCDIWTGISWRTTSCATNGVVTSIASATIQTAYAAGTGT
jgi:hypothetical protein